MNAQEEEKEVEVCNSDKEKTRKTLKEKRKGRKKGNGTRREGRRKKKVCHAGERGGRSNNVMVGSE